MAWGEQEMVEAWLDGWEEKMERSQTDQRATDVAAGAGNALGGECPVRPHTFTCGEISVYLWCCHFCTFLLFLFIPVVFCCQAYFFSSSFNLLLSCLLSIIFFAPCPQPVMAQTLNLAIFSSSSSLLPGALCFFFHSLPLFFVSWWLCTHAYTFPTLSSLILSLCLGHVGAVALTHSNWQITFLMEFNYLSLPHGDLARKRPTAAAAVWGRTGQKGKARRGGGGEIEEGRGAHFLLWQETGSPPFWFGEMSFSEKGNRSEGWWKKNGGRKTPRNTNSYRGRKEWMTGGLWAKRVSMNEYTYILLHG